ncbi:MAG TPA: DEAD/DEAH box helicase [Acidimicrobiales bacterium]|nr:DEAD/DEAH box helicase [Acidimicrobiales bacterium]
MGAPDPLASFHPALAEWFRRTFPAGPTSAQAAGWAAIAAGSDTLVAAPTGSGKTLAGFLVAIDRCLKAPAGAERRGTSVVYVSPLRALTVDVRENLEGPLAAIAALGRELGFALPEVRVGVRNGDTPAAGRAALVRDPPDILVTTPESLYLLATARRGRELLAGVETVIVDEIHALARDRRGAHLALTLERLERIVAAGRPGARRPTRIALSATQRPIEALARLLVGAGPERSLADGSPRCTVVDVGHLRRLDLAVELPADELGAVASTGQLGDLVASLAAQVRAHRTTLVFVNTRKMAERLAYLLAGELGEQVAAHHGSLSAERRLLVEARLRAGELQAVVATASLELGIDVGPVDLVCQVGSPRAIATFLQRVGRACHRLDGVPKGRLYPLTRDELVESLALLAAVRAGQLDAVRPPVAPLDILAQQIVAECAAAGEEGIREAELAALVRRAAPYADLADEDLEAVVTLVSEGVTTGRGVRGAHVRRDRVNGVLSARRGARLTATTSGGAIPELADYRVVVDGDDALVGTVHEDFAVEAMVGDVFLLGSNSWQVRRVEAGTVRVVDARGAPPTIPFWLGEAPARTDELADAVSACRELVERSLERGGVRAACEALARWSGEDGRPIEEAVAYLATARAELGALPTKSRLVVERFFDDAGGMQLVVHSPYGARVNRGLGLALRKRFCRTFDFELQAAASDDAVVLSLGAQHAFPLEAVTAFLSPETLRDLLVQAVLPTPIFAARWRWNVSRSLVSPRYRGARHLPPAIQRMEADDLLAAVFPALAACQENVSGPIAVPDHPLVRQSVEDCLSEAIDYEGLARLVEGLRTGRVAARCVDTVEASVLSHEILAGRPYTFLDGAPLEERRTRAVPLRRGIPLEAHDLSVLDEAVVAEVRREAALVPRDADELHDLLMSAVVLRPDEALEARFAALVARGRAALVDQGGTAFWCATERRPEAEALLPGATFRPDVALRDRAPVGRSEALVTAVRGHLELLGPASAAELAAALGAVPGDVEVALLELEGTGAALRVLEGRWWSRRLAARVHRRQRDRERSRFEPVSVRHLVRFLLEWQHATPTSRLAGLDGLATVLGQLQGIEAPVGAWESSILPSRVAGYSPALLDELCAHGEVAWGRLSLPAAPAEQRRGGATPSSATPVALVRRDDLHWLLAAARGGAEVPAGPPGAAGEVREVLEARGALFFSDLCAATGRLPLEIAEALWDGVARGALASDGFQTVRALLSGRYRAPARRHEARFGGRLRAAPLRRRLPSALAGGRWSLLPGARPADFEPDDLADALAAQLLERWGIVFRDLARREAIALPWREVLWALRRLEARGVARGGRFVAGVAGEQFALPEALELLRRVAARPLEGAVVRLSAADPLNLTGIVLAGPRLPALAGRELVLTDGLVLDEGAPASGRAS